MVMHREVGNFFAKHVRDNLTCSIDVSSPVLLVCPTQWLANIV
jgi:hypothetical protein